MLAIPVKSKLTEKSRACFTTQRIEKAISISWWWTSIGRLSKKSTTRMSNCRSVTSCCCKVDLIKKVSNSEGCSSNVGVYAKVNGNWIMKLYILRHISMSLGCCPIISIVCYRETATNKEICLLIKIDLMLYIMTRYAYNSTYP